jgi:hypothetical protein
MTAKTDAGPFGVDIAQEGVMAPALASCTPFELEDPMYDQLVAVVPTVARLEQGLAFDLPGYRFDASCLASVVPLPEWVGRTEASSLVGCKGMRPAAWVKGMACSESNYLSKG